jgi:CTP:molybdopterin cytidylyltransferase MocA
MAPSTPTPDPGAADGGDVVGIVLAAGAGRRMGGPKALLGPLAVDGRTPLARVCSWVHEAGCTRVIAVIGAEADAVRAGLAADQSWSAPDNPAPLPAWLTVVEASDWADGMGASLRAGLAAARETPAASALITLVDLPDVRTAVYQRVLATAPAAADALARASYVGRPGHPVIIGRDHWDAAASAAVGDQGARALFATTPHRLIECGDLASGVDADARSPDC